MRIVAVDPGLTTGIAYIDTERDDSFESFQLPTMEAVRWVEVSIDPVHARPLAMLESLVGLLVCEKFVVSAATLRKTSQYDALYSIGALRYLAWKADIGFELRLPSEREFATNARLKALGWRNPTEGGHADDAARHLLVTLVRRGLIDPAKLDT